MTDTMLIQGVKLVWITSDAENIILKCARVSSDHPDSTDNKLINYCIKNNHWSVFEMANMCVEITAPLFVINQIIRHKSFSFQQFSMRYQSKNKLCNNVYVPEFRLKEKSNRQSSSDVHPQNAEFINEFIDIYSHASELYDNMIFAGVAYECAREILPVCTLSRIYMNGNIRSWIHYLQSRLSNHSQKEHRYIANLILDIIRHQLPTIYKSIFLSLVDQ
jgi:thymidylate synthase (FAD)